MNKRQVLQFFKQFQYKSHEFKITFKEDFVRIQAFATLTCTNTGTPIDLTDTREIFYKECDESQLLGSMRNWLTILAMHESDENIRYKGKKPFDPHKTRNSIY